jgi:hypothetical protein
MKRPFVALSLACLLAAGCATSSKPKEGAAAPSASDVALANEKAREAKEKPPVHIGPDIIVENDPAVIWPFLIKVEDWGTWMPKVTKVDPGAGLSPGALINWQWEEKPVQSTIVTVVENQEFDFRVSASSKKATIKWTLKPMGPKRTLVSLRAEVPYGTASEVMDKLGPEMNDWITSLQAAVAKVKPTDEDSDQ